MIRAVFFDLDDTLCDAAPAFAHGRNVAFDLILSRHPEQTRASLAAAWDAVHLPLMRELDAGETTMASVRERRFRRLLAEVGAPDDAFADAVDLALGRAQLDAISLFPDVGVLETLRTRGLHVAIVTNGADDGHPDSQRSKAAHLGLLERVDAFHVSDATGFRKPDPRAFAPALRASGCQPEEAVHVGDSMRNDVRGAEAAGVAAFWLVRSGAADRRAISSLTEVSGRRLEG